MEDLIKINNLIEAKLLRGYERIDMQDGKISFRRSDDEKNMGDTRGWVFQYENWEKVRESLIDIPLWEETEITEQVDKLIELTEDERINRANQEANESVQSDKGNNMSLEERYTKAMELAGYERLPDPVDSMATVAFKNKTTSEILQTDGWEMIGDELEDLKPISVSDSEMYAQLIHPEGRISFYCKNLGGTGVGKDTETILFSDLESAIKEYLAANSDGKILGYKMENAEKEITSFSMVDMKNHFVGKSPRYDFFDGLTVNEREYVRNALQLLSPVMDKDNMYYAIHDGIITISNRCVADVSAGKTEWGAWIGHISNVHRPQDYIDVDITGYSTIHEVICTLNVIHANEICSSKQISINVVQDNIEESIRHGMENAIDQLVSFMHEAIETLDTDNEYPMRLYSPYTFHELDEHYKALENAGYSMFPITKKELKEMNKEEMREYIQNFFKQYDEELICTSRVLDSLATTVIKMIDSGQIDAAQGELENLLVKDSILNFIKQRVPLISPVPGEVQKSVRDYFNENLPNFTPVEICRISNHPEDASLYAIMAKKSNGEYACWTSWNQKRECMNYGHYGLPDREKAFSIVRDNFNDISDEIVKYGPEKSLVFINLPERIKEHEQNKEIPVIIPFKTRGR